MSYELRTHGRTAEETNAMMDEIAASLAQIEEQSCTQPVAAIGLAEPSGHAVMVWPNVGQAFRYFHTHGQDPEARPVVIMGQLRSVEAPFLVDLNAGGKGEIVAVTPPAGAVTADA